MKTKNDIANFAWHFIAGEACYFGWDYESDLLSCFDDKRLSSVTHDGPDDTTLLLVDWVEASQGKFTKSFLNFFKVVYIHMLEQVDVGQQFPDSHHPIMVSSHSGSSDYFTFSMLVDLVKENK